MSTTTANSGRRNTADTTIPDVLHTQAIAPPNNRALPRSFALEQGVCFPLAASSIKGSRRRNVTVSQRRLRADESIASRRHPAKARSNPPISSFFIWSMARKARWDLAVSGSLINSGRDLGHHLPGEAIPILQPAALLRL